MSRAGQVWGSGEQWIWFSGEDWRSVLYIVRLLTAGHSPGKRKILPNFRLVWDRDWHRLLTFKYNQFSQVWWEKYQSHRRWENKEIEDLPAGSLSRLEWYYPGEWCNNLHWTLSSDISWMASAGNWTVPDWWLWVLCVWGCWLVLLVWTRLVSQADTPHTVRDWTHLSLGYQSEIEIEKTGKRFQAHPAVGWEGDEARSGSNLPSLTRS